MDHNRRAVMGLVLLSAIAYLLSRSMSTTMPDPNAQELASPQQREISDPSMPQAVPPSPVRHQPGLRQPLTSPPARTEPEPDTSEADTGGVLPEQGRQAAGVPFSNDAFYDAIREAAPDIKRCVDTWRSTMVLEENVGGRLEIEVTLGPEGVEDAALLNVDGIPPEMTGCFSGIIYEVAWPVPEESTTMVLPFLLELVRDPVEEE
jgi:hypothetical protein